MSWTDNYWDIVNEFYWVPSYLGLKSIPQRHWEVSGDTVTIPKEMTNPSGPLYRRLRSSEGYWDFVRRQEETFNHIFNLTLSLLPGEVISELFDGLLRGGSGHGYQLRGSSIRDEYDWIGGGNVTSPDSFLTSEDAILAIEIKFNAKTSVDQLAKYVALIAGEAMQNPGHEQLDLLYIYPTDPLGRFSREAGVDPSSLSKVHLDMLANATKNSRVQSLFRSERDAIADVLSRLRVSCVSWAQVQANLSEYMQELGGSLGDQTLFRLLQGLESEIIRHPLSQVQIPGG